MEKNGKVKRYPLMVSHGMTVEVGGRELAVQARCRMTAEEEDGAFTLSGAEPGGFLAGGETFDEAVQGVATALSDIIKDTAEESNGPAEFRAEMNRFLKDGDDDTLEEWHEARKAAADGAGPFDWMIRAGYETDAHMRIAEIGKSRGPDAERREHTIYQLAV